LIVGRVSFSDIIKWCRRVAQILKEVDFFNVANANNSQVREIVFLEAMDIFSGWIANPQLRYLFLSFFLSLSLSSFD
jgi:hypothetical protein